MVSWLIHIYCGTVEMGSPIPASMWDILSKLAAVKERYYPLGWNVEAYPVINREVSQ